MISIRACALTVAASAGLAVSAEIPVGPQDDLAELISNAEDGDVFVLDDGLYITETVSVPPVREITIRSTAGASGTTIMLDPLDAPGALFEISSAANVTFEGVTLKGNDTIGGWDVLIETQGPQDVTVNSCVLEGPGQGIQVRSQTRLRANATTFQNLDAEDFGSALSLEQYSSAILVACSFINNGNPADGFGPGGAIHARQSHVVVRGSAFQNNRSDDSGGAIRVDQIGSLNITDSVFANNTASQFGGAIFVEGGALRVLGSRFENNAASVAGAIYARSTGNPMFDNTVAVQGSTFIDNAGDQTTHAYLQSPDRSFSNNTVLQTLPGSDTAVRFETSQSGFNRPSGSATHNTFLGPDFFGVRADGSTGIGGVPALVANNIVRGFGETQINLETDDALIDFNNIQGLDESDVFGPNNIDEDPQFVDADARDFRLLQGSPSIDAGSPQLVGRDALDFDDDLDVNGPLPVDALGNDRVIADQSPRPDHGPFEFNPGGQQPACLADLVAPFGITDLDDVNAFIASFIAGCP